MKKGMGKNNFANLFLFGLVLVFMLLVVVGNVFIVFGEEPKPFNLEQPDTWKSATTMAQIHSITQKSNYIEKVLELKTDDKKSFYQNIISRANWEDASKIIIDLKQKKIEEAQEFIKQISSSKVIAEGSTGNWNIAKLWVGNKDGSTSEPAKKAILEAINSMKDDEKTKYFDELWNDKVHAETIKKDLIVIFNKEKNNKDMQKLRNDFFSNIWSKELKDKKYSEKHPGIKVDLGDAELKYDKSKIFIGNTEITLDKWITGINYKDGAISAQYSNQGYEDKTPKRIINFPKEAKTLLNENGAYNGVDLLYGTGGTINVATKDGLDTYSFTGGGQPAIFSNGVIYSGKDGSSIIVNSKAGAVVGGSGEREAWFNLKYGNTEKPNEANSYGYINIKDTSSSITYDQSKLKDPNFKGVVLVSGTGGAIIGIVTRGVNGVDIVGKDYSGNPMRIISQGSNNIRVARFNSGSVVVEGDLISIPYQGEGETIIEGFGSPDLKPVETPVEGSTEEGNTNTGGETGNTGQNTQGGNMGSGPITPGQYTSGGQAGPLSQNAQKTKEQLQVDQIKAAITDKLKNSPNGFTLPASSSNQPPLNGWAPQNYKWTSTKQTSGCSSGSCQESYIWTLSPKK